MFDARHALAFHIDSGNIIYIITTSRSGAAPECPTCVDLVEDCKKATCIHFLCRNKVKSKERKQNS